jgi:hypothetical protein
VAMTHFATACINADRYPCNTTILTAKGWSDPSVPSATNNLSLGVIVGVSVGGIALLIIIIAGLFRLKTGKVRKQSPGE